MDAWMMDVRLLFGMAAGVTRVVAGVALGIVALMTGEASVVDTLVMAGAALVLVGISLVVGATVWEAML